MSVNSTDSTLTRTVPTGAEALDDSGLREVGAGTPEGGPPSAHEATVCGGDEAPLARDSESARTLPGNGMSESGSDSAVEAGVRRESLGVAPSPLASPARLALSEHDVASTPPSELSDPPPPTASEDTTAARSEALLDEVPALDPQDSEAGALREARDEAHEEPSPSWEQVDDPQSTQEATPSVLPVSVGVDSHTGEPIECDASRFGHGLVVGTSGSGKSVFINSLLVQLLQFDPRRVGLILIDPKYGVELGAFEEAPHLVRQLVDEPCHAPSVLQEVVSFMDRRYRWLRSRGLRCVSEVEGDLLSPNYLFVVIEELADLGIQAKGIWEPVIRIAQKGRAAGVSLICVTQQNSVRVLPSVVLANLPTRIGFKVTSTTNALMAVQCLGPEKFRRPGEFLMRSPALDDVRVGRTEKLTSEGLRSLVEQAKQQYLPLSPTSSPATQTSPSEEHDEGWSPPSPGWTNVVESGPATGRNAGSTDLHSGDPEVPGSPIASDHAEAPHSTMGSTQLLPSAQAVREGHVKPSRRRWGGRLSRTLLRLVSVSWEALDTGLVCVESALRELKNGLDRTSRRPNRRRRRR